jgi:FkbM family methyltransferase
MALGRAIGHLPVDVALQHRLVDLLRGTFEHPRLPFEVDFRGHRYPGSGADVIDMYVYYYGVFEWWVVMLLRDLAGALGKAGIRPVFYDIGANSGHHSLYLAREAREIHAFEPYPPVREKFEQRIRMNKLDHIRIHPVALGDVAGTSHYYPPITINQGTGSFLALATPENSRRSIPLPVARGDDLIAAEDLPPPDLVKLDVEGSEKLVLRGLQSTIHRHRPVILSELSTAGRALFGDEAGLRELLYPDCRLIGVRRRMLPRGYRLQPFDFARDEQVLCLPAEKLGLLRGNRTALASSSA